MLYSAQHQIANFTKYHRSRLKMTQEELAERAGVGLRFIRDLEQGKETLRMDKVNQVLQLFGFTLSVKPVRLVDPYDVLLNHFKKVVLIQLKNKKELFGLILEAIYEGGEIKSWKFLAKEKSAKHLTVQDKENTQILSHADIEAIENV